MTAKLNMYAIKCLNINAFMMPFTYSNDAMAIAFVCKSMAHNTKDDEAKDLALYRIGTYDLTTGYVTQDKAPEEILNGKSLYEAVKKIRKELIK